MRKKNNSLMCQDHLVVTDLERGEIYCGTCGIVFTEKIENLQYDDHYIHDGNYFSEARTGPSMTLTMHDKGLYTLIGGNKDSSGHSISGQNRTMFYRLRSWDKRSKSEPRTRNLGAAFTLLHGLKTKLAIPENVLEKAAYIYRKAQSSGLIRGRSFPPILIAALYVACRESNTPRTLNDLSKAGNVKRAIISSSLRLLIKNLNLRLEQYDISDFIARLSNNLNFSEKTKRMAFEILQKSKKIRIVEGKNPMAFATASLYLASVLSGETRSQAKFSDASGISCVTIRNTSALIKSKLKLRI